jgi:hypothetical protein
VGVVPLSDEQLEWELGFWEAVFPEEPETVVWLDDDFLLNLLDPEVLEQETGQAVQGPALAEGDDTPGRRPNPHAGERIGEASNPGPGTIRKWRMRKKIKMSQPVCGEHQGMKCPFRLCAFHNLFVPRLGFRVRRHQ